jgi:thiol:disulfide interchange protein DsbA
MACLTRFLVSFTAALLVGHSFAAELQAGRDYTLITPPLATPAGKVEVIEFFSYACAGCNAFQAPLRKWADKLPKDVKLRHVPVSMGRALWARLSRVHYTLEVINAPPNAKEALFPAAQIEPDAFGTDDRATTWAAKNSLDSRKFNLMLGSYGVQSMMKRADQEALAARVKNVPSLVIDGKYLIDVGAVGGPAEALKHADALVAKARKEKKLK